MFITYFPELISTFVGIRKQPTSYNEKTQF